MKPKHHTLIVICLLVLFSCGRNREINDVLHNAAQCYFAVQCKYLCDEDGVGHYFVFHASTGTVISTVKLDYEPCDLVWQRGITGYYYVSSANIVTSRGGYASESLTDNITTGEWVSIINSVRHVLAGRNGANKLWVEFICPTNDIHYISDFPNFMLFPVHYGWDPGSCSVSIGVVRGDKLYLRLYDCGIPDGKGIDGIYGVVTNVISRRGSDWTVACANELYNHAKEEGYTLRPSYVKERVKKMLTYQVDTAPAQYSNLFIQNIGRTGPVIRAVRQ